MPIAALAIGAVGTVASAVIGANAAKKAAAVQAQATKDASATTMKMYEQTRTDLAPYSETGAKATGSIADLYGLNGTEAYSKEAAEAFKRSPDYQNTLNAGESAISNLDAASRSLLSGAHVKRAIDYAGNLADTRFNSYLSRLFQISGMGENAAARTGNAAMSTGSSLANLAVAGGEAQASGIVGGANQVTGAIGNISSNLAQYAANKSSYATPTTVY